MLSRRASDGTAHRSDVRLFFCFGNGKRERRAALSVQAPERDNRWEMYETRFHSTQCTASASPRAILLPALEALAYPFRTSDPSGY